MERMAEISINQATGAAADLVRLFNNNPKTPPQSHAVWVETGVNEHGEFVRSICVSEHPGFQGKLKIPSNHAGVPVKRVSWPKGQ